MSDNIIPFRRRDENPESEANTPSQADAPDPNEGWTLVQIVAQAPPTSR